MFVRKVKVLKKPKFERKFTTAKNILLHDICISVGRLLEMHGEGATRSSGGGATTGTKVERDVNEPPVQTSV